MASVGCTRDSRLGNPLILIYESSHIVTTMKRHCLPMHLLVAVSKLVRLHACAAGAVATILGAYIAHGLERMPGRSILAVAMVVLLISASNSFNDAIDSPTDRVFKPTRPIPSGRISLGSALRLAIACDVLAVIISASLGLGCLLVAACITLIAWLYSVALKGVPLLGNTVVGATAATPVIIGGLATGGVYSSTVIIAFGVALYQIAFEIIKTLRDVNEDAAAGLRTLGSIAPRGSAILSIVLIAAVVTAVVIASATAARPLLSVGIAAAGVVVPNVRSAVLLARSRSKANVRQCLRLMRISWFPGLALFFFLSH